MRATRRPTAPCHPVLHKGCWPAGCPSDFLDTAPGGNRGIRGERSSNSCCCNRKQAVEQRTAEAECRSGTPCADAAMSVVQEVQEAGLVGPTGKFVDHPSPLWCQIHVARNMSFSCQRLGCISPRCDRVSLRSLGSGTTGLHGTRDRRLSHHWATNTRPLHQFLTPPLHPTT